MTSGMTGIDRDEMRGLVWQLAALCTVVLGVCVLKTTTRADGDGGLMTCIAVVALILAMVTATQIGTRVRTARRRSSAIASSTTQDDGIAPQSSAPAPRSSTEAPAVRCASTAHVIGEVVSASSQYRETVEHDARTPRLARAPKGPTMIYCPR